MLSDFVNLNDVGRIMDLGAGVGILGMLMARKYPQAEVTLLELQKSLYKLMIKNISLNNLDERVTGVHADIRALPEGLAGFDIVVANPPFRRPGTGHLSEGDERAIARHEIALDLGSLMDAAVKCLRPKGRLYMVYHPGRLNELIEHMRLRRLEPKRMRFVNGKLGLEGKMVLIEAVKGGRTALRIDPPLIVYKDDGTFSDEMKRILNG